MEPDPAPSLVATLTGARFPFDRIEEFTAQGESLEVRVPGIEAARVRPGAHGWERFQAFLPFRSAPGPLSLGEGGTPLLPADARLRAHTGIAGLLLKNEAQNPTWSFKDRGSLACVAMALELGETVTATISTGNMGHSIAAYGARAGLRVLVFVPAFTPREKILAMSIHGATVLRIEAPDYSEMKAEVLGLARKLNLRIVSGNGPVRVEGYKLTAFEMWEQMAGAVPDYIAVPTSACGHLRGIFKGYRELMQAGLVRRLPKMIVVQARNNSPVVSAIRQGLDRIVPFSHVHTIAEAITAGNPQGGDEIVRKARDLGWPAEDASEEEILESQRVLARSGYFVEPASAAPLAAVRKLRAAGVIEAEARVVLMLTGSGMKDSEVLRFHPSDVREVALGGVESALSGLLGSGRM